MPDARLMPFVIQEQPDGFRVQIPADADPIIPQLRRIGVTWDRSAKAWTFKANDADKISQASSWVEHLMAPLKDAHFKKIAKERVVIRASSDLKVGDIFESEHGLVVCRHLGTVWSARPDQYNTKITSDMFGERVRYAYVDTPTIEDYRRAQEKDNRRVEESSNRALMQMRLRDFAADAHEYDDCPEMEYPRGEVLYNDGDPRAGKGFAWILVGHSIWYVTAANKDGDWSATNLPGAIGYRLPHDAELVDELRRMRDGTWSDRVQCAA